MEIVGNSYLYFKLEIRSRSRVLGALSSDCRETLADGDESVLFTTEIHPAILHELIQSVLALPSKRVQRSIDSVISEKYHRVTNVLYSEQYTPIFKLEPLKAFAAKI